MKLTSFHSLLLSFTFVVLLALNAGASSVDNSFIAGYTTAVLEREFNVTAASLSVKGGVITLRAEDLEGIDHDKIITILSNIKGVVRVEIVTAKNQETSLISTRSPSPSEAAQEEEQVNSENSRPDHGFLPKGALFDPLIADPRWPHFSVSYQYYIDDEELRSVGATSFGATIPLYRNDAPFGGQWQVGIQAAVFAIFDLDAKSYDLINADYWVGLPISYRKGAFSSLLRVFHQSSHLGDEYLLRNQVERDNISYESVDLKLSYDFTKWLRIYAGGGYLFHRVPSDLDPWSVQYGLELKSPWTYFAGVVRPIAGVDFKNWEEHDWDADTSARIGIQLESEKITGHKLHFLLEYFHGHSPNGQFYERAIEYIGIGTHFYF